jgi:glycosyltransferase involved in cell wall biosynthesis
MISKALVAGTYHKKLEALAASPVDLHAVIPRAWAGQRLEVAEGCGYSIHSPGIVLDGHNHLHFYRGLEGIARRVKPEIIHVDEEHYSLVTFQSLRVAQQLGARSLFFTWQNIHKKYPFPFSSIERYSLRCASAAIAGNREAADVLRRKGFRKDVFIIPQFGVDPATFHKADSSRTRQQAGLTRGGFVVGYVGRLVREKGILDLVEALRRVSPDSLLLVLGSGPLKNEVLGRAGTSGLRGRVKVMERVPSALVPGYLNCLDCLVLPSRTGRRWKEQFGRVLIEAMACEVPVVGSSSGEIPNVIGDAGLVFREGDVLDLADKIELLQTDRNLREQLGRQGRQRVLATYTHKGIAAETYRVYQHILAREVA